MQCEGKIALVTGSANGLGKAIAESLLTHGANVCVCDVNVKLGQETVEDFQKKHGDDRTFFSHCDVSNENDIRAAIQATKDKFGGLDVMVNNAGIIHEKEWQKMLNVNLVGTITGTRLAIDTMRADRGGRGGVIVNTASISAVYPCFNIPVYTAAKHGVMGFTRSCATNPEYKQAGLSFAVICPGGAITSILLPGEMKDKLDFPFGETGNHLAKFGHMPPEKVGEAFLKLLREKDPNGAVVAVSEKYGINIQHPDVMDNISLV